MREVTKEYTNGEVTVVWKNSLCVHSAHCFRELPEVFHPLVMPWITPEASTTDTLIEQVCKCPSGALSYFLNNDAAEPNASR